MYYDINNSQTNKPLITIRGIIGDGWFGVTEEGFIWDCDNLGDVDEFEVHISSQGGSVQVGLGIYNYLKNHKAKVTTKVYSEASSIASVIFLAGDERIMLDGTSVMIHNPSASMTGEQLDFVKASDFLAKTKQNILDIYTSRTNQSLSTLSKLMDDETMMNAHEALRRGFATKVSTGEIPVENSVSSIKFKESLHNEVEERKMNEELKAAILAMTVSISAMSENVSKLTASNAAKDDDKDDDDDAAKKKKDAAKKAKDKKDKEAKDKKDKEAQDKIDLAIIAQGGAGSEDAKKRAADVSAICAAAGATADTTALMIDSSMSVEVIRDYMVEMSVNQVAVGLNGGGLTQQPPETSKTGMASAFVQAGATMKR